MAAGFPTGLRMEMISTDKKTLKNFGITMAAAFFVIAVIIILKHRHNPLPFFIISAVFCAAGCLLPAILKPAYIAWMKLAFILGWINTRLILAIVFYLFITPIAVIARLFGSDLLDQKIDKKRGSYWIAKETTGQETINYQRQF